MCLMISIFFDNSFDLVYLWSYCTQYGHTYDDDNDDSTLDDIPIHSGWYFFEHFKQAKNGPSSPRHSEQYRYLLIVFIKITYYEDY